MGHIGIDLHKNSSQVCILTEDDELVERRLETLGHEVIVADPNFAPMYAARL